MSSLRTGNLISRAIAIGSMALFASTLSGCVSESASSPTPSISQTAMSDAQALVEFNGIVDRSFAMANENGITQSTVNSIYGTYLLVADKTGSEYQATEKNPDGSFQLIFEADAFVPSATKSWLQLGAKVSYGEGRFTLTREIEGKPTSYIFEVVDGLLVSESGSDSQATWVSSLRYQVTPDALAVLQEGAKISTN